MKGALSMPIINSGLKMRPCNKYCRTHNKYSLIFLWVKLHWWQPLLQHRTVVRRVAALSGFPDPEA
jgi:hypothetical protein